MAYNQFKKGFQGGFKCQILRNTNKKEFPAEKEIAKDKTSRKKCQAGNIETPQATAEIEKEKGFLGRGGGKYRRRRKNGRGKSD